MSLTPQDIQSQQFNVRFRGFDVDEVDAFLEKVAEEFLLLNTENQQLKDKIKDLKDDVESYKSQEKSFQKAILSAQRLADELAEKARQEADELRQKTDEETRELRDTTIQELNELRENTQKEVEELREKAISETTELREKTQEEVASLKENAEREAEALRESTIAETNDLRQRTEQEAAELKEKSEKEAAELLQEATTEAQEAENNAQTNLADLLESVTSLEQIKTDIHQSLRDILQSFIEKLDNESYLRTKDERAEEIASNMKQYQTEEPPSWEPSPSPENSAVEVEEQDEAPVSEMSSADFNVTAESQEEAGEEIVLGEEQEAETIETDEIELQETKEDTELEELEESSELEPETLESEDETGLQNLEEPESKELSEDSLADLYQKIDLLAEDSTAFAASSDEEIDLDNLQVPDISPEDLKHAINIDFESDNALPDLEGDLKIDLEDPLDKDDSEIDDLLGNLEDLKKE